MKIHSLLAVGAAASMAVVSSADFTDITGEVQDLGDYYVVNLFANFDDPNNVLLNLFDVNLGLSSGEFNHSDTAFATGGSFNYVSTVDIPGFSDSTLDSYVTIGTEAAALDPGFGAGGGGLIPGNAGWYDGTPTSYVQGETISIGQFVFANTGEEITLSFEGTIGYKGQPDHTNVLFADGLYSVTVPAPGALALLGLGGLAARRRRA